MDITPKTPWKERRIKSGSFLDRKLSADILKVRRAHDSNIRDIEKRTEYSAFMVAVCLLGALVLMMVCAKGCHAQEIPLQASWYSIDSLKREGTYKHSHGRMANGHIFSDNGFTCATRLFPLGSTLRVNMGLSKAYIIVKVTDRIGKRFAKTRIDLSRAAFQRLARLDKGLINVEVERI